MSLKISFSPSEILTEIQPALNKAAGKMVRNIGLGAPWNLEPCLELSINRGQAVTADRL